MGRKEIQRSDDLSEALAAVMLTNSESADGFWLELVNSRKKEEIS